MTRIRALPARGMFDEQRDWLVFARAVVVCWATTHVYATAIGDDGSLVRRCARCGRPEA